MFNDFTAENEIIGCFEQLGRIVKIGIITGGPVSPFSKHDRNDRSRSGTEIETARVRRHMSCYRLNERRNKRTIAGIFRAVLMFFISCAFFFGRKQSVRIQEYAPADGTGKEAVFEKRP